MESSYIGKIFRAKIDTGTFSERVIFTGKYEDTVTYALKTIESTKNVVDIELYTPEEEEKQKEKEAKERIENEYRIIHLTEELNRKEAYESWKWAVSIALNISILLMVLCLISNTITTP